MLIQIEEGVAINSSCIESIERRGKLSSQIIMQSGNKHIAQIPYESLMKIAGKDSDIQSILKNIDKNTLRYAG
jgi:hypothetical protein